MHFQCKLGVVISEKKSPLLQITHKSNTVTCLRENREDAFSIRGGMQLFAFKLLPITIRELPTFHTRRFANVVLVTQSQLTPVVATENEESASF